MVWRCVAGRGRTLAFVAFGVASGSTGWGSIQDATPPVTPRVPLLGADGQDEDLGWTEEALATLPEVDVDAPFVTDLETFLAGAREPAISADGRYLVLESAPPFEKVARSPESDGSPLRADDDGGRGIWRIDVDTHEVLRVDEPPGHEAEAGGIGGRAPSISANGRYVAFHTAAALEAGDTNGRDDVYRRDLSTGELLRISLGPDGGELDGNSRAASLSGDGQRIVFESDAPALAPELEERSTQVFLHDVVTGTTRWLSRPVGNPAGHLPCRGPRIAANGELVVFESASSILDEHLDPGGHNHIFAVPVLGPRAEPGPVERISLGPRGELADHGAAGASVTADGRWVAFRSRSHWLPRGAHGGWIDQVWLRDRNDGTTRLVDRSVEDCPATSDARHPLISADGRTLAYIAHEARCDGERAEARLHLVNLESGKIRRVGAAAPSPSYFGGAALSGDGRRYALESRKGQGLEAGVGLGSRPTGPQPRTYCMSQTNSLGCTPRISCIGRPSASSGSPFYLRVDRIVARRAGVLIYSVMGPNQRSFGGGFLCVQRPLVRCSLGDSGGTEGKCNGSYQTDFMELVRGRLDPSLLPGATVWAQYWSRDPESTEGTTNLSDAIEFTIQG